ncbi:MAG: outer membrane beta-barrel protein [Bacteroidales bacterium]
MKKSFVCFSILLTILFSDQVKAQKVGSLWIHALAGLNSDWILSQNAYGNPEMEYSTTFGPTGGVGVDYFFSKQYGFNGSVFLSKLGQNYKGILREVDADRRVKLTYVEVPLLLMLRLTPDSHPLWLSAGPDIMILAKAKQKFTRKGGLPLENDYLETADITDRFKPVDIALNFNVNKMFLLKNTDTRMLAVTLNSAIGLTDINSKDWQTEQMDGTYRGSHNFYIGFKVGLMFNAL